MLYISRVIALGGMLSSAFGQTPTLFSSELADDNATEKELAEDGLPPPDPMDDEGVEEDNITDGEWAEDELPPYDPIDEDVDDEEEEEAFPDAADFLDPFRGLDTPITIDLKGGKLQVYMRHSGKGSDRLFTLDFGHAQEIDANGKVVKGRSVKISKAAKAAENDRQVSQLVTSVEVVGGAQALVARLSMPLAFSECGDSSEDTRSATGKGSSATGKGSSGKGYTGSDADDNDTDVEGDDELGFVEPEDASEVSPARRLLMNESDDGLDGDIASELSIEAYIFLADASLQYGDQVIEVSRGQFKFNILSSSWPFCGEGHSLLVDMGIHLEGRNQKAKHFGKLDDDDVLEAEGSDSDSDSMLSGKSGKVGGNHSDKEHKTGKRGYGGKVFIADSGETEVFVDMPTFAIVDGSMSNCSVELDTKGGKSGIAFTFPAFNSTLLYDPTGGTTEDLSIVDATTTEADAEQASTTRQDGTDVAGDDAADGFGIAASDDGDLLNSRSAPAVGGGVRIQHLLPGAIIAAMVAHH